jgi:hypothetical protein
MGLPRNRLVWVVRRRVPQRLEEAVAQVLDNGKPRQLWLQTSTGTKERGEAKLIAVDVLASFDLAIDQAEALLEN